DAVLLARVGLEQLATEEAAELELAHPRAGVLAQAHLGAVRRLCGAAEPLDLRRRLEHARGPDRVAAVDPGRVESRPQPLPLAERHPEQHLLAGLVGDRRVSAP